MWLATTIDFLSGGEKDCEHHLFVCTVQSGTPKLTVTDTILSIGPIRREISWHAPFTKCERDTLSATVWQELEIKKPV